MNRRDFIRGSVLTAAAACLPAPALAQNGNNLLNISLFSKPLHWIRDYDLLAETIARLGIQGIDLTVRPDGHVLPENVERDLPKAVKAARQQGLKVDLIVTAITASDNELSERIVKTAAQNGVRQYRMGYLQYDFKKGIEESLTLNRRVLEELAKLNQSAGITGCYQNHHAWKPGMFGGAIWDLHQVLKELDPAAMACQYDVRHAICESTGSWSVGTRLIAPWIRSICLKDFNFKGSRNGRSYPENVPAGQGEVPWKEYFALLQELRIDVPATVHVEWELLNEQEKLLPERDRIRMASERLKTECDFYRNLIKQQG